MKTRAEAPALPTLGPRSESGDRSTEGGVILSARQFAAGATGARPYADAADRYDLGQEIARGGMGRIVEAFDLRHRRRVAIKFLLRGTEHAALRFEREIGLTARLEHPSIVTLYDAGTWSDGRPFFAMKLVEGQSFDAVAAAATTLEAKLGLLPHVIAATEALAYAHEHHVVHRDLKPSNILVGAFGETVVIDWGLAKNLLEDDAYSSAGPIDDPFDDGAGAALLTTAGRAIGTPCYMPPEQARGGVADARSDVYALGAILYHVLAGSPPYEGQATVKTLELVLAGPPTPLETRAPRVPPDLVAIVRKAMARSPDARYPTAKAMATDLTRFAAGQLVAAREYSALTLVRRWATRHRLALSFAAALVGSLLTVGALSVRRVVRERHRADVARASADTHRLAAEDLVDFVLGTLRGRLEPLGKLELMSGVGREVQAYYERVGASGDALDAATLNRRAEAFETLANVEYAKRDADAAATLWMTAIAWRERARAASTGAADDVASTKLVADEVRLADLGFMAGHYDDATSHIAKARAISDAALARARTRDALLAQANLDGEAGLIARLQGHPLEGDRLVDHAVATSRQVAEARPDDDDAQWAFERAIFDRGNNEYATKKYDRAASDLAAGTAILQRLLAHTPDDTKRLRALGWSASLLAYAEMEMRHMDAADRAARTTLDARVKFAAIDPANAQARREVMASEVLVCQIDIDLGRFEDAATYCRRAREAAEQAYEETHQNHTSANDLIVARDNLGTAELYAGRPNEARAELLASVALASTVSASEPSTESWVALHNAARPLALVELRLRDFDRAEEQYEMAARGASHLPADGSFESYTASAALLGAQVALARGDLAQAEKRLRQALPITESAYAKASSDVESQVRVGETAFALAQTLERSHGAREEIAQLTRRGHEVIDPLRSAEKLRPIELAELQGLGAK